MSTRDHWAIVNSRGIILEGTEKIVKNEWDKLRSGQPSTLPKRQLSGGLVLAEIHDRITIKPGDIS